MIENSDVLTYCIDQMVDDRTGEPVPDGIEGTSVVLLMVRDAYANYVVQTTLDVVSDEREKNMLMKELNSHSTELVRDNEMRLWNCRYSLTIIRFTEKLHLCQTYRHEAGILVPGRHTIANSVPLIHVL